jgi:hypothetical protein
MSLRDRIKTTPVYLVSPDGVARLVDMGFQPIDIKKEMTEIVVDTNGTAVVSKVMRPARSGFYHPLPARCPAR